ncbi:Uncharacterised protein [Sphingobacterium spiritivorum]|uniref:Uncharacterized protein n=1 Tax=Sphingobacterium spiritivorum TaxID=258 RepID=A0A380CS64_SPHSI|nr:hypothetical protein [Sphingobacterium spiritivorum]SUJ25785.1 Uncharacterised protein [Sphingobacterium spiritivorum]
MIPQDYESWKDCIENKCGIALTADFVSKRLNVYTDAALAETQRFVLLYGEQHRQRIIEWLQLSLSGQSMEEKNT